MERERQAAEHWHQNLAERVPAASSGAGVWVGAKTTLLGGRRVETAVQLLQKGVTFPGDTRTGSTAQPTSWVRKQRPNPPLVPSADCTEKESGGRRPPCRSVFASKNRN